MLLNFCKQYLSRIESLIQKDTKYLIIGLAVISIVVVLMLLIFLILLESVFNVEIFENDIFEKLWYTFIFFIDPGRIAEEDYNDNTQLSITFKILTTGFGIIAFSTLIATISQVVHDRIEKLRSGLKNVTSINHIIIIGFTNKTMPLLHEFFEGLEDKKETFVIYTEKDPVYVQKQINEYSDFDEKKHDIIIKVGNASSPNLTEKLNIKEAKKIIILNKSENDIETLNYDLEAIEFFTKIVQSKEWITKPSKIVVEINNPIVANTARDYCKDFIGLHSSYEPTFIFKEKFRNLFFALSLNNAYVLEALQSLFGFVGKEFYFLNENKLLKLNNKFKISNKSFGQIIEEFREVLIVGLYWDVNRYDHFNNEVVFCPDKNFIIKKGMGLIIIDEKVSSIEKKLRLSSINQNEFNINTKVKEIKKENVGNISVIDTQGFNEETLELFKKLLQYNEDVSIQNLSYISLSKNVNYIESGIEKKNKRIYKIKPTNLNLNKYKSIDETKQDLDSIKLGVKLLAIANVISKEDSKIEYYYQVINFIDKIIEDLFLKKGINKGDFILTFFPNSENTKQSTFTEWKSFNNSHIPENGDNPLLLDFQTKAFILERMFKNEKLKKINVAFFKNYGEKIHIASFNREELDFLANTCNEFNYKNFKKLKYEYDVNNSVGEYTLLEKTDTAFTNSHQYKFFLNNKINKSNKIIWLGGKATNNNIEEKDYLTQFFLQQVSNSPNTFSAKETDEEGDDLNEFSAILQNELDSAEISEFLEEIENQLPHDKNEDFKNIKNRVYDNGRNLDVLISTECMKTFKTLKSSRDKTYSKYNIALIEQNTMMAKIIASYSSEPMISKILNTFYNGSANIDIKYFEIIKELKVEEIKFYLYKIYGYILIGIVNFNISKMDKNKILNNFLDIEICPNINYEIKEKKCLGLIVLKNSNNDYNYRKFDESTAFRYNYI